MRTRLAVLFTALSAAVVTVAAPAAAAPHYENPPSVQVGYTDKATPRTAYDLTAEQDMPLGAWRDDAGATHVSRVYATFDVSRFAGRPVRGATVQFQEHSAADCTKRAIEVWQTVPVGATPTWRTSPSKIRKLDETDTVGLCPNTIRFDVSSAVVAAAAHNRPRVTFEFRVPARHERDVSYGRQLYWYAGVGLTIEYNNAPAIDPAYRFNGGFPCGETAPYPALGSSADMLQAMATDPDPDDRRLRYEFAVWPSDDPTARTVLTHDGQSGWVSTVRVPGSLLVDGNTLSWQVQVSDGVDTSPWSSPCSYVVDKTKPQPPQLVCPDPFTSMNSVRADAHGGSATVTLNPPRTWRNRLLVASIDRAGLLSDVTTYEVSSAFGGEPVITVVGEEPEWGDQVTLRFSPYPGITGTVDYTYRINHGQEQTITAGPDGAATVTFTASNVDGVSAEVRSRSANGWVSPRSSWSVPFFPWPGVWSDIYVPSGEPVGGVGVTGTFIFSPPAGWTEVGGYQYSFNGGEPVFVAASPDRRATITWTPEESGWTNLEVRPVRPDGSPGDYANHTSFDVAER